MGFGAVLLLKKFFNGLDYGRGIDAPEDITKPNIVDIATGRQTGYISNGYEPVPAPLPEATKVVTEFSEDVESLRQLKARIENSDGTGLKRKNKTGPRGSRRLNETMSSVIGKLETRIEQGGALTLEEFQDVSEFFSNHEACFEGMYFTSSEVMEENAERIGMYYDKCDTAVEFMMKLVPVDEMPEFLRKSVDSYVHERVTDIMENGREVNADVPAHG